MTAMKRTILNRMLHASPGRRQRREFTKLQEQYRGHADKRRLDYDWRKTNFNRISVVNLLLSGKRNGNYLEIGCATNILFDSVMTKNKIGVDPEQGGTHRMTSDEFFRQNGGNRYDVVFIDGLHTYEQTHMDVLNALRCVGKGGWIALHDMIPRDWLEEHVPRLNATWTGDVWKVAFELAKAPDIDFKICAIDHGVGVLRVLKDDATIPDMSAALTDKRFGYFYDNIKTLPVVDYETARAWIEGQLPAQP